MQPWNAQNKPSPTRLESSLPGSPGPDGSRLVVVISEMAHEALLASRLVQIALLHGRTVLLFGIASNLAEEGRLRRELVPLAGLIREAGVEVESAVSSGRTGLTLLAGMLRSDDMLACSLARASTGERPNLVDALASIASGPIHVFDNISPTRRENPGASRAILPWIISTLIILGFFWLDIWISRSMTGGALTVVTLALLGSEIGLLWLSNSLFS